MKLLILLILFSCARSVPTLRSSYTLKTVDNFLVSNIYVDPAILKKESEGVIIEYDVIVKNLLKTERNIDLTKSVIKADNVYIPIVCKSYQSQKTIFKVGPNETFRISCIGKVSRTQKFAGDSKLIVAIPLEKEPLLLPYLVRSEDFE